MHIDPHDRLICTDSGFGRSPEGEWQAGEATGRSKPVSQPIVQSSLFSFPDLAALQAGFTAEHETNLYSRGRNPTVQVLERKLASLERGEACLCFGSGMAAVSAVLLSELRTGDHVLFVNDTYGPTLQLAGHLERFGIAHDLQLELDPEAIEAAIRQRAPPEPEIAGVHVQRVAVRPPDGPLVRRFTPAQLQRMQTGDFRYSLWNGFSGSRSQ